MFDKKFSNSEATDELLLNQIKQGDQSSFNILYERYWQLLYVNAFNRLKDSEQAKDIVQEVFAHIWLKKETLAIENIPAYLHVAVRNKVFKIIAKQKLSHSFFSQLENVVETQPQADSDLLTKEFFSAYEALVKTLSTKKQIIFRLRYQEELSTRDIAHLLKLSRKTVQNQLLRAIEHLKVSLFCLLVMIVS